MSSGVTIPKSSYQHKEQYADQIWTWSQYTPAQKGKDRAQRAVNHLKSTEADARRKEGLKLLAKLNASDVTDVDTHDADDFCEFKELQATRISADTLHQRPSIAEITGQTVQRKRMRVRGSAVVPLCLPYTFNL